MGFDTFGNAIGTYLADREAAIRANPGNVFGAGSVKGNKMLPDFLRDTEAGTMSLDWLKSAFQDLFDRTGLSQQHGQIESAAQSRADAVSARSRFRGSPLGEAFQQAIFADADRQKAMATSEDQTKRLGQGIALTQAVSGALTNPLLQVLGIAEGSAQAEANRRLQRDLEPDSWEKVLGGIAGIFCWVAREIIPARWRAARAYMIMEAPASLLAKYWQHGERLAANLTDEDRSALRPVFEDFADRGAKYLEV